MRNDSDYVYLLSLLFNCMTIKNEAYSAIIIWVDEFEDIATFSSFNSERVNNFFRELLDNVPNGLLIFLNLTLTSFSNVSDLAQFVSEAVKSRIRNRINFEIPTNEEVKQYLREILKYFYTPSTNPAQDFPMHSYYPFAEDLVNQMLEDIGHSSLRGYNEAFSLILELAADDDAEVPISLDYYNTIKNEIIGWKEVL